MKKVTGTFSFVCLFAALFIFFTGCNKNNDDHPPYNQPGQVLAPGDLTTTAGGTGKVILNWVNNSTTANAFDIQRSLDSASGFSFIGESQVPITTFTDSTILSDQKYYYRVRAKSDDWPSEFSNVASYIEYTVKDNEGNHYHTVKIGNQTWLQENLSTVHFNNGDPITDGTGIGDYTNIPHPQYFFNFGDDTANVRVFGRLYTWDVIDDSRGICPAGYHVPTSDDFDILLIGLGGYDAAGAKLKTTGTAGNGKSQWEPPNTGATNESGFSAQPGGYRDPFFSFNGLHEQGYWWSKTESDSIRSYALFLSTFSAQAEKNPIHKFEGLSVRCIKY